MNNNHDTKSATTAQQAPKKAYATPKLVEYGDVRELTKGLPAGSRSDGFRRKSGN